MIMRKPIYIAMALLLSICAQAQDMQRFSQHDFTGTARYMGMAGAMTAIGGDPTAAVDNPAGLGLYRRKEVSISLDNMWDYTCQKGQNNKELRTRFAVPELAVIWSMGNGNKQRGVIYNNLMFCANRMATFNRSINVSGDVDSQLAETICRKTNGLTADALHANDDYMTNLWNNEDLGWLSIMGYQGYLIDPKGDADNNWMPAVALNKSTSLQVEESGYLNQYTISWAMNISNQWYVGLGLNIPSLTYSKDMTLRAYGEKNDAYLKSYMFASGVGFGATIGAIYRPCEWVRIGAAFQTPTMMSISVSTSGSLTSNLDTMSVSISTPDISSSISQWVMPMRANLGVALQVLQYAMLSFQYDLSYWKTTTAVHTFRVGTEVNIVKGLYINAGCAFEPTFIKGDVISELDYNSIRTDTECRYINASWYASAGIGYRWNNLMVNAAYQYRRQYVHQYATEMQYPYFNVLSDTHRFSMTLAWRFN